MQYQTKWVRNMLKLFSSRPSSLMRTFLLTGLVLGSLVVAIASLQLSQMNVSATSAASNKHVSYGPAVSIKISSHIDQRTVTYTLTIRNAANAGTISKRTPIAFTDSIPKGLSNIRAKGDHWAIKVHSKVSPSLVTGTYRGSYPVDPGATLPTVTITGTIARDVSHVLTNSASVDVPGNTDQAHHKAIIHDNIGSTSSSSHASSSNNESSPCDSECSNLDDNSSCDSSCDSNKDHNSSCDSSCIAIEYHNSSCDSSCDSSNDQASNAHSESDQQSVHISVRQSVDISSQESVDESCGCDGQQSTNSGNHNPTSNTSPNPGKGATDPVPAMPNTGSDPSHKG